MPLFDRSGRTIRLTDAGEVWRQYASRALQELGAGKRAIHDVADLTRGSLRIAVTPTFTSYFIGPLMADFYARYPGITLQLQELSRRRKSKICFAATSWTLGSPSRLCIRRSWRQFP